MDLPEPRSGLVVRYGFLWANEAGRGQVEAAKDRPCAIIVTVQTEGGLRVTLAPVTHAPPRTEQVHVELSAAECRAAGLDAAHHWVVVTELNRFVWPGYDLREVPGTGRAAYGMLPRGAMNRVFAAILELQAKHSAPRTTGRD